MRAAWGADFGHLGCELDIGPKTKFEGRELVFIFHLETIVIRALDQQVIRFQSDSVSALTTMNKIPI